MISERVKIRSEGVPLTGRLVGPDSGIAERVVLCITGGGVNDCDVPYLRWQEHMEEAGIASLAFNARGVGGSGGVFRTDSPGYDPNSSPANSQASRANDSLIAYRLLMEAFDITNQKQVGVIGGSRGGDIALHTLDRLDPGAMLLRAPSAYPGQVHRTPYGPAWSKKIQQLGGEQAALESPNFVQIVGLKIPLLLIYTDGDKVIPTAISAAYKCVVAAALGKVLVVGDITTPHTYLSDVNYPEKDLPSSASARAATYIEANEFFLSKLG